MNLLKAGKEKKMIGEPKKMGGGKKTKNQLQAGRKNKTNGETNLNSIKL